MSKDVIMIGWLSLFILLNTVFVIVGTDTCVGSGAKAIGIEMISVPLGIDVNVPENVTLIVNSNISSFTDDRLCLNVSYKGSEAKSTCTKRSPDEDASELKLLKPNNIIKYWHLRVPNVRAGDSEVLYDWWFNDSSDPLPRTSVFVRSGSKGKQTKKISVNAYRTRTISIVVYIPCDKAKDVSLERKDESKQSLHIFNFEVKNGDISLNDCHVLIDNVTIFYKYDYLTINFEHVSGRTVGTYEITRSLIDSATIKDLIDVTVNEKHEVYAIEKKISNDNTETAMLLCECNENTTTSKFEVSLPKEDLCSMMSGREYLEPFIRSKQTNHTSTCRCSLQFNCSTASSTPNPYPMMTGASKNIETSTTEEPARSTLSPVPAAGTTGNTAEDIQSDCHCGELYLLIPTFLISSFCLVGIAAVLVVTIIVSRHKICKKDNETTVKKEHSEEDPQRSPARGSQNPKKIVKEAEVHDNETTVQKEHAEDDPQRSPARESQNPQKIVTEADVHSHARGGPNPQDIVTEADVYVRSQVLVPNDDKNAAENDTLVVSPNEQIPSSTYHPQSEDSKKQAPIVESEDSALEGDDDTDEKQ